MNALREETLYEVLEVPSHASEKEIERSYGIVRETYEAGSSAVYSVLSDEESADILRRVEEAYAVLSDARLRREYDARLSREGRRRAAEFSPEPPRASATPQKEPTRAQKPAGSLPPLPAPAARPGFASHDPSLLDDSLPGLGQAYDGPTLRRIRLARGIELEEVSAITKVNLPHLKMIEENRYEALPALVYLRGFLRAYARAVHLDDRAVTESYLQVMHGGKLARR